MSSVDASGSLLEVYRSRIYGQEVKNSDFATLSKQSFYLDRDDSSTQSLLYGGRGLGYPGCYQETSFCEDYTFSLEGDGTP